MDPKLENELVTVTIKYGENKTHTFHGRATRARRQAVIPMLTYVYTCTEAEAIQMGEADKVADWVSIHNEHGGAPSAPAGARGAWGTQVRGHEFTLATGDWVCNTQWSVRTDSPLVQISAITDEGRAWIEQALSTDLRLSRLEEKLRTLDPALANELDDVVWRVREDARSEGRSEGQY